MNNKYFYFAYGSNMSKTQMTKPLWKASLNRYIEHQDLNGQGLI